jgi:hypothetical protein
VHKKRRLIQPSDSEEEAETSTQKSDVVMDEPQIDSTAVQKDTVMKDLDAEFDKEVEEAAIEEKAAKKEKIEMMSIIHSM